MSSSAYAPPVGFYFKVSFDGLGLAASDVRFQEVAGLTSELGIEEVQEGGENRFSHRLPARAKFGNLILKRGMFLDSGLIKWFQDGIENFDFKPVTVTVNLLDESRAIIASWNFSKVWPVRWIVSDFKAQDGSLIIETIELCYSHFKRM